MNYDLQRLSPGDFEDLAQSLAINFLGPQLGIFGSGPDGGREATFDGPVPIETACGQWNGYGVLQVKAKEELTTPAADADWLITELKKEFRRWNKPTKSRIPEYYIIITNIKLSAVEFAGGLDKVERALESLGEPLGLRGYQVWHFEKICRLLDNAESVRKTYRAWITPGDILSKLLDEMDARKAHFLRTMESFLAREFMEEQNVNLRESGSVGDNPTSLADVMIDLPLKSRKKATVLRTLIGAGDRCRPRGRGEVNEKLGPASSTFGRYVVVGGPGQGKSTVSQWLCQVYRAALLQDRPEHYKNLPELQGYISRMQSQVAAENLPFPLAKRWPFRINLTQFADAIADNTACSLLDFLAARITKRMRTEISVSDLQMWLEEYPWLIVLDGLDEVPASSNRAMVLAFVQEFWLDVSAVDGDVIFVATTRPQGYSHEFSPEYYTHLELSPLDRARASHYFTRLITARLTDTDRRELVTRRFERALAEQNTAHLMRSPLQVTIMSVLLERVGEPPRERYSLFKEYYRVIYQRELEKGTIVSSALRDYQTEVDAIHHYFGLQLQMRGEEGGGSEAVLSESDFRELVMKRLLAEEHEPEEARELAEVLIQAALERLVFIVPSRADGFGFEVRSLQEFMAAEAIADGRDDEIVSRLINIGPSDYWRNVALFVAGKILVDRQALRPRLLEVFSELNTGATGIGLQRTVHAGSNLALDALEDGAANRQPGTKRLLTNAAVDVLTLPPNELQRKLAAVHENLHLGVVNAKLNEVLGQQFWVSKLGAWNYLAVSAEQGDKHSLELLEREYRRTTGESSRRGMAALAMYTGSEALLAVASSYLGECSIEEFLKLLSTGSLRSSLDESPQYVIMSDFPVPGWILEVLTASAYFVDRDDLSCAINNSLGDATGLSIRINPCFLDDPTRPESVNEDYPEKWLPAKNAAAFIRDPSVERLISALESFAASPAPWQRLPGLFPWILLVGLEEMRRRPDLTPTQVASNLGEPSLWRELENRWSLGVHANDLSRPDPALTPSQYVIEQGKFPLEALVGYAYTSGEESGIKEVYQALSESQQQTDALSSIWHFAVRYSKAAPSAEQLRLSIARASEKWAPSPDGAVVPLLDIPEGVTLLHELGLKCSLYGDQRAGGGLANEVFELWMEHPHLLGLLRLTFSLFGPATSLARPNNKLHECGSEQNPEIRLIALLLQLMSGDALSDRLEEELTGEIANGQGGNSVALQAFALKLPLPRTIEEERTWFRLCSSQSVPWQVRSLLLSRAMEAVSQERVRAAGLNPLL
ncbi:hypothetical protein IL992_34835 [Microbispora sp. NEAU-D428]|uniref:NACHT domain-containing protein n=1 Tax=Microbispora sitophila TaxID=2771537 RepID=UPI001867DFED|nr:hypothetical protein [Microbispora sitophila]MBE3014314.1 hypothetical protein [Microbispora sitophila]